jgi:hypothetical protein
VVVGGGRKREAYETEIPTEIKKVNKTYEKRERERDITSKGKRKTAKYEEKERREERNASHWSFLLTDPAPVDTLSAWAKCDCVGS